MPPLSTGRGLLSTGCDEGAEGNADYMGWTEVERPDQFGDVVGEESNAVRTKRLIGLPMASQVGRHYPVAISEIADLVLPVSGAGPQAMDEEQRLALAGRLVI